MTSYAQDPTEVAELSKQFVEKHIREIGKIRRVTCCANEGEWLTIITGDEGRILVDGFAWGFYGERPHGLLWLLDNMLGIPVSNIAELDRIGPHVWKIREEKK